MLKTSRSYPFILSLVCFAWLHLTAQESPVPTAIYFPDEHKIEIMLDFLKKGIRSQKIRVVDICFAPSYAQSQDLVNRFRGIFDNSSQRLHEQNFVGLYPGDERLSYTWDFDIQDVRITELRDDRATVECTLKFWSSGETTERFIFEKANDFWQISYAQTLIEFLERYGNI